MDKKLKEALRNLTAKDVQTFPATVTAVDKTQHVVSVQDTDDFVFDDVRLSSVIDNGNKIVQYPAVGTTVLISRIGDDDNTFFVAAFGEVESIAGQIGDAEFHIDALGYKIDRADENLKQLLTDFQDEVGKLCDELNKVVVSIGVTPNVAAIAAIKQEITQAQKTRLEKILK